MPDNTTKTMEVDNAQKGQAKYTPPKQSANTLFHFMKKFEYLLPLIDMEALIPRYCIETVDYLSIGIKEIAYPMLCFCDINLHKIDEHMTFYGGYGIAFSKEWGIKNGIQPIQYINSNSILKADFSLAFDAAMKSGTADFAQDYLLSQMYYFKAIEGEMLRDGKTEHKNFTDECEWRFIPDIRTAGLPQAVSENEKFSLNTLNTSILYADSCWLKYGLNDIKYIIVQTEEDFRTIMDLIDKKTGLGKNEKNRLTSKMLIWSDAKGDF